jgi:hypothetical protein
MMEKSAFRPGLSSHRIGVHPDSKVAVIVDVFHSAEITIRNVQIA